MRVNLLRGDLTVGLGIVSRVITGKAQLPVLANVLIEAEKSGVRLSATNLSLGFRVWMGGKVSQLGKVTVPARNFSEFVNSLLSEGVEIETEGEKVKIRSGKYAATLAGIAAEEFPPFVPQGETWEGQAPKVVIKKKMLGEISREVAYAAAVDESRPGLTGIQFKVDKEHLTVTATDGFRLARKIFKIQNTKLSEMKDLILPARTALELARVANEISSEKDTEVEVMGERNQILFRLGDVEIFSRILEGNFPEVDKIIPVEHKTKVTMDKEELGRAVRAAGIFGRENNNIIQLSIHSSQVSIRARSAQAGEGEVEVEAEVEGEEVEVSFNYKYVLDCLGGIDGERVILKASGNLAPAVWEGEKKEDYVALIMPVRV